MEVCSDGLPACRLKPANSLKAILQYCSPQKLSEIQKKQLQKNYFTNYVQAQTVGIAGDFKDKVNTTNEYRYDAAGIKLTKEVWQNDAPISEKQTNYVSWY